MCLTMMQNSKIERNLSDVTVYKVLTRRNKSVVYNFPYKKNTLYRLRKALKTEPSGHPARGWVIFEGFHSYLRLGDIPPGLYAYDAKVVKMIVPKGAMIAYGTAGDVVSTSIRSESLRDVLV